MNIKEVPCLAYIIASAIPENVGRVVEVQYLLPPFKWQFETSPEWSCVTKEPIKGLKDGREGAIATGCQLDVEDCDLRPIGGVPLSDDTTTEETKPQEVPV